ncbi:MAG TPA: thiamine phosphate synthase [Candidatus Sulfotelmatobacter sp.]|nr:thiamine phosphate synthase [Candidatus Sulfotelmatobacter sp.]
MVFYYITDRKQFPGSPAEQRARLLAKVAEASRAGVDLIQLREKDLPPRELEALAKEAVRVVRENAGGKRTRLLINSRADVAIAAAADGVHLRADDIAASEARVIFTKAGVHKPVIGVSCHSVSEVRLAESHGADFAVFGPVFEKSGVPGQGLASLRAACGQVPAGGVEAAVPAGQMPVLALGGVTQDNAAACLEACAAGVAAIRLFQENDIASILEDLKSRHKDARK